MQKVEDGGEKSWGLADEEPARSLAAMTGAGFPAFVSYTLILTMVERSKGGPSPRMSEEPVKDK